MNLRLNNKQVYLLAELLEPYRTCNSRHARNLVRKMDELVKMQKQNDKEAEELIAALHSGRVPNNCICCTEESIFGKENA